MTEDARLTVILCWHMHQPEYRDCVTGSYRLPWTLLHALKDYVDMAAHLEATPGARAVVNFAPVLLEQIEDCAQTVSHHLRTGSALSEPLLGALSGVLPKATAARAALVAQCLRAHDVRVIGRFAPFAHLRSVARRIGVDSPDLGLLSDAYLLDLVTWHLLGWMAETVRRRHPLITALQEKGSGFDDADRRALLELVHELLGGLLGRYRALADAGVVELAMSPYAHPILPLLLDLRAGLEAEPGAPQPLAAAYPGGADRARWHLRHGREVFVRLLGREPHGCWPSEGALSTATVRLLAEEGFRWCASGESVLRNSLAAGDAEAKDPGKCLHRVYRVDGVGVDIFFRDDGLSDLIGFRYADWHADDAVGDLLHHISNIASACPDRGNSAVSIVMDGENAWEHYPENAFHFLGALYQRLAAHPLLSLGTFDSFLAHNRPTPSVLPQLVAGSWVYGTLSTWVGSPDKNRGWDLLVEAKTTFDRVMAEGRLDTAARAAAQRQLAICEGSDWFWWLGDYNPAASVSDFEQLFRMHLANLYRLLGEAMPAGLTQVVSTGHGDPALGGVMRPGSQGG